MALASALATSSRVLRYYIWSPQCVRILWCSCPVVCISASGLFRGDVEDSSILLYCSRRLLRAGITPGKGPVSCSTLSVGHAGVSPCLRDTQLGVKRYQLLYRECLCSWAFIF